MNYMIQKALLATVLLLGIPTWIYAQSAAELITEARQYLEKGQINAGVIQLKNALKEEPTNAEARYLLGMAYLRSGDVPAAEKELSRARDLDWAREKVLIPLGRLLLAQRQFQRVLDEFDIADNDTDDLRSDIFSLRGSAEFGLGNSAPAQDYFQKALELAPEQVESLLGMAQIELTKREYANAADYIGKAITANENRVESWLAKAKLHSLQRQHAEALDAYNRALTLQSNNIIGLLGRAESQIALGDFDQAMTDAENVRKVQPRHPQANFIRAQVFLNKQDNDSAETALNQVLRLIPDHKPSQLLLGSLHYNKGNLAQAEDFLSRFVNALPQHLPARKLLAATQMKMRNPKEAVETLSAVANSAENQQDAQYLALLGSAFLQSGDYNSGSRYLQQATEIAPDVSAIRTQLALSHLATGNTSEAVSELESAVDMGQDLIQADVLLALTHLRNRDTEKALATAAELVQKRPDDPMPLNLLGVAYMATGDDAKARQTFEDVLALQGDYTSALVNLARLDLKENKLAEAQKRYQQILDNDSKNLQAILGLADLASRAGRQDEFIQWLERAWEANPEAYGTGAQLVRLYLQKGDSVKALSMARELHNKSPKTPVVQHALGLALIGTGDSIGAQKSFKDLTENSPKSAEAWYLLGAAQIRNKQNQRALRSFDKAIMLKPEHLPSQVSKAELLILGNQYDSALESAHKIQTLAPKLGVGHRLEGDVYLRQQNFKKALTAFEIAHTKQPSARTTLLLGNTQRQLGDTDSALKTLQQWLEGHPDAHNVRLQLGMLFDKVGDREQAIETYKYVIEHNPDNLIALNNLAWLYGDDPKAIKYAERASELAPNRPEISDTLGWVLVQNDELRRGMRLLKQAAVQAPHLPEIRYHLAVAYAKSGRVDEAREALERLIREGEAFSEFEDAKALLKQLQ